MPTSQGLTEVSDSEEEEVKDEGSDRETREVGFLEKRRLGLNLGFLRVGIRLACLHASH